ncbi:MAG: hypothetical protein K9J16_03735 [Melioribacteraceae bacterium]|nr:hypothetical protein [Melioribacteraceae bacterium]MCF8356172.1 hypothetical protein [Melioribacteraceae bacterium]MCF8394743.1 hypothetical protein [Melioribacteraceae bacterium]
MMIILSFILLSAATAQNIGEWKNYTSMRNTNNIVMTEEGFWATSDGGIFYFNNADSSYQRFMKSEGLSSHAITSIAVDNSGKIWIADMDGFIDVLNPADNSVTKILEIFKSDFENKTINSINISGDTAFVSTNFGLSLINTKTQKFYETVLKFNNIPTNAAVNSVLVDEYIYVATAGGIAVSKPGVINLSAPTSWISYEIDENVKAETVYEIVKIGSEIFASSDKGLLKKNDTIWNVVSFAGLDIQDIFNKEDSLFVLTTNKLYLYLPAGNELIYSTSSQIFHKVIITDNTNYIATNNGIFVNDGSSSKYLFPNGPVTNFFESISVDNDGVVWVGTGREIFGAGVFSWNGLEWKNYNKTNTPEFLTNSFHKVFAAPDNVKYFLNWGRGFTRLKGDEFNTFYVNNTDLAPITGFPGFLVISDVKYDSHNNAWILNYWPNTREPLSVLTSDSTWYHYEFGLFTISDLANYEHFVIDQYDTKWFAETNKSPGLYYFNENQTLDDRTDDDWGLVSDDDGLSSNSITCLTVDRLGELWVGTNAGLDFIPNPSKPTSSIQSVNALRQQFISAIAVDPLNQKWVGSSEGLIVLSSDGRTVLEQYDKTNSPLPSNQIKAINIDEKTGTVYIGTDYGMVSLKTSAIKAVDSFDELFVYPNPFYVETGNQKNLTIEGLIANSEIKILSIGGELIASTETNQVSSPGGKIAFWNGRNLKGEIVPSGIYLIVAYDEEANNVTAAKVAVLRK